MQKTNRRLGFCGFWTAFCIVGAVLWVRSYFVSSWWPVALEQPGLQCHVWKGRVYFIRCERPDVAAGLFMEVGIMEGTSFDFHPTPDFDQFVEAYAQRHGSFSSQQSIFRIQAPGVRNGYGFVKQTVRVSPWTVSLIGVPFWFIELLGVIPLGIGLRQLLAAQRRGRTGFCARCGYDLRATPSRCPECGAMRDWRRVHTTDCGPNAQRRW
jgi:hypothetical protein